MWAAQHCSILFSSGQNRLCVFCCICTEAKHKILHFTSNKIIRIRRFKRTRNVELWLYRFWQRGQNIALNNFQPPRAKLTNPAFMYKLASIYLFTAVTFASGNLINDICTRFVLCSSVRLCLPSGAKISSNSRMMFSLVNIFSCCFI